MTWNAIGNKLYGFMGLRSKKSEWSGVDGVDTSKTVMTTRAPVLLSRKQEKKKKKLN